ncbi:Wzz/FepE/Etk N-terminal domain-containing protein [Solibacillus sp. FSL W7-1436]|uniref:Wzz/FepE/Etk N-terminal domain-containing protein n=1 Tax=Solibacillus sp. FSL W7-1436 TaxID=2921705 RepID=UPI0030FBCE55
MRESLELRELIDIILKGKWTIVLSIIIGIAIAYVISWYFLEEEYESKAVVQVASGTQDTGIMSNFIATEFTPLVYIQRIQNETKMNEAFNKSDFERFNPENLLIKNEPNSNLVELVYTGLTPQETQQGLQVLINETKSDMNNSVKKTLVDLEATYLSESEVLSSEIENLMVTYNNLISSNGLPEILILQTISDTQFVIDLNEKQSAALANIDGNVQNQLLQIKAKIDAKSDEYRSVLAKYQSVKTGLDSFNPDPFIRIIIEPTYAENPTSPNKLLNLIIGFLLATILGTAIVLFSAYWKRTENINTI